MKGQQPSLLTYSNAIMSADGRFRYYLVRRWKTLGPNICFIMLNPSSANQQDNDPTINRCMDFSRRWGYSGLVVVNAFAFRSTNPARLKNEILYVGAMNDYFISDTIRSSDKTVCAWGTHEIVEKRAKKIGDLLDREGLSDKLYCLGLTSNGSPRHPLYVPKFTELKPFRCPTTTLRLRLQTGRQYARRRSPTVRS